MSRSHGLAAALVFLTATVAAAAEPMVYRIELAGSQTIWAKDSPRQAGGLVLFHRYPGGVLMSVKASDVKRIVQTPAAQAGKSARGGEIVLGPTGEPSRAAVAPETATAYSPQTGTRPGERRDGSALFNADRPYRPDWDSKQVPGATLAYPASPSDYREGATYAHPPGNAVVPAPGEPPMMKPSSGEVPKGPQ